MSAETTSIENKSEDARVMVWWDIDNTLYSANTKISQAMGEKIGAYFMTLGLDAKEAAELHLKYYTQYGLALAGLVRHHNVDPIDFDKKCDGSLPLESMIRPNVALRQLFLDIDRSKARVWALTNAYRPHAERVLKILQLDDLVEGIVFCDYAESDFTAKPEHTYYHKALAKAGITDPSKCYFVDDNRRNIDAARELGWGHCVHFCEAGLENVEGGQVRKIGVDREISTSNGVEVVSDLQELRTVWKEIFRNP
ncbi:pyrimidine 5-nucleotidase [Cylindrobasidium torrendii FP15055 ss-10]|uniref:Pyrimidine 5-nucleotidase n=1 Tax=Cylindrobasidium torrendii FP15055 ss-10 TaxID=1314674 RepID=A0A0D7BEB5_9AGAR|nr:pyrimidine 5-nucleotidase [Cylindrobasidium torrendii FP15055 ss-10]